MPGARGRFPQLGTDAEVVIWNGGLWNWLDPETAVRAVARLAERRPRARLVFMGTAPTVGSGTVPAASSRAPTTAPPPAGTGMGSGAGTVALAAARFAADDAVCAVVPAEGRGPRSGP